VNAPRLVAEELALEQRAPPRLAQFTATNAPRRLCAPRREAECTSSRAASSLPVPLRAEDQHGARHGTDALGGLHESI
jgi:hypothetical protein